MPRGSPVALAMFTNRLLTIKTTDSGTVPGGPVTV